MLTPEVREYVQERRLSFALRGPWLTERTPVVSEPEPLVSHLDALAGLVPLLARATTADPSRRARPASGTASS